MSAARDGTPAVPRDTPDRDTPGRDDLGAVLARRLVAERRPGAPLVVMLDVDGTIAPIVPRPEDAAVPDETRALLAALAARPDVHVALVSGRSSDDAARVVGLPGLWLIGNHGAEAVAPDGTTATDPLVLAHRDAVAAAARELAAGVAAVPGAILEDKRLTLSLHWRRVADPADVARLERLATDAARRHGLTLHAGKMVFELRPPVDVHKGTAVLRLARRLGADAPGATLLFAGDDVTDEDAFRALRAELPHAVTVRVAAADDGRRGVSPATAAELTAAGLADLREGLRELLARLAARG